MPEAKQSALRALAIDETVADAHFALAFVLHFYEWNWARAECEYRRAMELDPGDMFARGHNAVLLASVGRADAAVGEARHAMERDLLSLIIRHHLSLALCFARRYEESIAEARAGLELDANHYLLHWSLGLALAGQGRHEETVEAFRKVLSLAPTDPIAQASLAWAYGLAGQKQEALTILDDLERRRSQGYVGGFLLALPSLGMGDHDRAISWLERGAEERDGLMTYLNLLLFDPLRSDPRFQALLKKMNFPAAPAE